MHHTGIRTLTSGTTSQRGGRELPSLRPTSEWPLLNFRQVTARTFHADVDTACRTSGRENVRSSALSTTLRIRRLCCPIGWRKCLASCSPTTLACQATYLQMLAKKDP